MLTEQQINRIKRLLNDKSLSFIIGAGFSKNMSDKFVDWGGLLKPITQEMFHLDNDIEIKHKIEEVGYLEIAQEYVRRKGYHEAIDVYIEQHTPVISIKENPENPDEPEYKVTLNNKIIGDADITCHKLLFELDAKHIFTFNYDNCLDIIGKTGLAQKLLSQIRNYQNDLEGIECCKEKLSQYTDNFNDTKEKKEVKEVSAAKEAVPTDDYNNLINNLNHEYPTLNLIADISFLSDNYRKTETEIGRIKAHISSLQKKRSLVYQLISSSEMLSLTDGKRSIFKLHGSIRLDKNAQYGFDGDTHCNYIITSDDYKGYPIKHEPFVDYMKISLLKGAFCIIGFSCDDPNFLSWMSWVKEVVDKNAEIRNELSQKNSARFFYIHSDNMSLSEEKKLLLRNHYIECVELFHLFSGDSHKERITKFLENLLSTSVYYPKIKKAWDDINKYISSIQFSEGNWDVTKICNDIEFISWSSDINRIPIQSGYDYYNRDNVLHMLHGRFRGKWNTATKYELKLAFSALREELLLLGHYFEEEYKQLVEICDDSLLPNLKYLAHKEQALTNQEFSWPDAEVSTYIRIWKHLFCFDFRSAKNLVDSWETSKDNPFDGMRRLMFKSLFNEDVFNEIPPLTNYELYHSLQDYLNALELLPLISRRFSFEKAGGMNNFIDFSEEVNQLQTDCQYIKNANYIIDKLIESVKGYDKATPFGNKSHSFVFGNGNLRFVNSFKVLSIFFELCRPLHINNIILFSEEKWSTICDNLYQDYPYPCLFYSLQYNSTKLTKSISQKILYCDALQSELPQIVKSLFVALRQSECPDFYRASIMKSIPILLIGVNPTYWNRDFSVFYEILQPYAESGTRRYDDLNYRLEYFYDLVTFGLKWTSDKNFKLKAISEILHTRDSIDNWRNALIIQAKKFLTKEDFLNSTYYQQICQDLLWLCQNGNKPAQIYVILNLVDLLDAQTVQQCLEKLPESMIASDCTLLRAIPHYIEKDSTLASQIKQLVLKSSFLWRNGIGNGSMSIGVSFLDITDISGQLDFSAVELEKLWERMKISLLQIKKECENRKDESSIFFLSHFDSLLDEMKSFAESNTFSTIPEEEYDKTCNEINSLRISIASSTSQSIHELLVRDETSDAISILVGIKPEDRFPKYQGEYVLLANKIILMKSQYLNSCMNHFSWIVDSYSEYMSKELFKPLLEYILIAYEPYFSGMENWDISYAKKEDFEKGLMKIYNAFRNWNGLNPFWQSYKPRFVNH